MTIGVAPREAGSTGAERAREMDQVDVSEASQGQLRRVAAADRPGVVFTLDGTPLEALEGDSVLTAMLVNARHVRRFEFSDELRAGFCWIGACQDCWLRQVDGTPVRACTTPIEAGMALVTGLDDGA